MGRGVRPLRGAARPVCIDRARHRGGHRLHRQPDRPQLLARPLRRLLHRPGRASRSSTRRAPSTSGRRTSSSHLHVRRHVEDPDRRRPPHRPLDRAWAATRRRRSGSLLACPDVLGEIDAHPGARRQGRRHRPRAAPAPPTGRRVAPDRPRHRRRVPARDVPTCSSPRAWSTSARVDGHGRTASTSVRDACAEFTPEPVEASCRGPGRDASAGSPASSRPHRARCRLRPHRPVQPGVRHAGVVAGRRRQHPHRPLRPPGRADVRQAGRVAAGVDGATAKDGRARRSAGGRSRVRGAPEVLGQVPVSCLAEEIDTPGDGQIQALFTIAGNPVISAPDVGPARRRAARSSTA